MFYLSPSALATNLENILLGALIVSVSNLGRTRRERKELNAGERTFDTDRPDPLRFVSLPKGMELLVSLDDEPGIA